MTSRCRDPKEMSDAQWLLHELDMMPGCADTKSRLRRLLTRLSGKSVYFPRAVLERPEDIELAGLLLMRGQSVARARETLRHLLGVSRSTAYILIGEALRQRGPRA